MNREQKTIVLSEEEDSRLDHVLGRLLHGMGLRGRRRLCGLGLVLVNGCPAKESRKMRVGDEIIVKDAGTAGAAEGALPETGSAPGMRARLIKRTPHLAFLFKPAGLHTEMLAGKPGTSLQAMLPDLLGREEHPRLLNRLDFPTSGLVTAALDELGARRYQEAQEIGRTEKRYLALLEGEMPCGMLADRSLDMRNREKVLVGPTSHPDPRRYTVIAPLAVMESRPLLLRLGFTKQTGQEAFPPHVTLAGCTILKGARHQIRAHCSSLGFPLLGDRRYGAHLPLSENGEERFFLHHACLILPGVKVSVPAPWLSQLGRRAAEQAERWLGE